MIPVVPLPSKTRIAEYQVLKLLGQGGFGTTYLCVDANLNRKCVIKEYTPHYLVERKNNGELKPKRWMLRGPFKSGLASFLKEARLLACFNHPNIVRINRYFEAYRTGYFVMDYESGSSLRDILSQRGAQFEEQEIEAIILPLCMGLEQLHKQALIHRDIKPDNIIIRPDGTPVLIDFGAAFDLRTLGQVKLDVIATPHYAPPEQFDSNLPQGPWLDIYALGATMYEMISGHFPIQSLQRLDKDDLIPAREIGRGMYGDRLLGLIDKSLSLNSTERPKNIEEFIALLKVDNTRFLKGIIRGISQKTIQHFLNWAKANPDLYLDEFVAFSICFPIIDLSWRLGKGTPTKDMFLSLYQTLDHDVLEQCQAMVAKAGFSSMRRNLTLKTVEARLDEYAATYLLDRQAKEWRYEQTRKQCAKNCLTLDAVKDVDSFMSLMEDVIDRARGRVKKEFEKAFRKVEWIHTPNGWKKEIRGFV